MKTLTRLVRRYIVAAVSLVLLILLLHVTVFVVSIVLWGIGQANRFSYSPKEILREFTEQNGVPAPGKQHSEEEWFKGYAWAMMLDEEGKVIWQYQLPDSLDREYSLSEAVTFSRWYLQDYPVIVYTSEWGIFVVGYPVGSLVRYNIYFGRDVLDSLLGSIRPLLMVDVLLLLAVCIWAAWRMNHSLGIVEHGLDALAQGRPVELPESGATAALAEKLNRTGEHLRRQSEALEQRDTARTYWIAGVSHDIRTPLSVIMGTAERLEHDPALSDEVRDKGKTIRRQGQRIKSLIEDLNLTSKLQYNAQPLRLENASPGALLRTAVAEFCNSPLADVCTVGVEVDSKADARMLPVDKALFHRALENILNNSARHNPSGCHILAQAIADDENVMIRITDTGSGYPPAVLAVLGGAPGGENAPHILGLHLVGQIIAAHGGDVCFSNAPGARVEITLPAALDGGAIMKA